VSRPVFVGCDVQTTGVGFAAIDAATGAVAVHGWLPFRRGDDLEDAAAIAINRMQRDLLRVDVRAVAVERVGGGRGVQSMLAVANAAGVFAGMVRLRYDLATLWRPTPAEWKQGMGLGGNASKDEVRAAVADIIAAGRTWVTVDIDGLRQDVCDAIGIAWADRQAGTWASEAAPSVGV